MLTAFLCDVDALLKASAKNKDVVYGNIRRKQPPKLIGHHGNASS